MTALATIDDLETRLGDRVDNSSQAEWMLRHASGLVKAYCRRDWDDGDIPDGARTVTVEIVFRAVTNPEGATQDSAGSFSVSFGPEAAQRMYLTRADREILDSIGGGRSGIGTLSMSRGPLEMGGTDGPNGWFL